MRSQNKNQLAYLCALTLLFSYAEMILPRVVPFFRLGLANTVILLALDIKFSSFLILSILKATAASLTGGTLFSPFFLISLLQSVMSALVMRGLYKLISRKAISLYGISVAGSAVSAVIQILLTSFYIGNGTFALLGPMLIFNTVSGIITAFFSEKSGIKESISCMENSSGNLENTFSADKQNDKTAQKGLQILFASILILTSVSVFFIKNLIVLGCAFILSLAAQKLAKRKIYLIPHISMWLFIFVSAIFVPNGKVLFKLWSLSITQDALLMGAQKALTLSTVSALSQCAVSLKPGKNTLLGQSLVYFKIMSNRFRESDGSIIKRITYALCVETNESQLQQRQTGKEAQ